MQKLGVVRDLEATFSEFAINLVARSSRLGDMLERSELLGSIDGGRIVFSMGVWPLRMRWEARHFGYVEGERFSDEQKLFRDTIHDLVEREFSKEYCREVEGREEEPTLPSDARTTSLE